jgi:hypothetical protein
MITINAYVKTNGERSEAIEYNKVVYNRQELNAVKSLLMQSNPHYQIDLIYSEQEGVIPVIQEPLVEVHVKDLSGVIERNKINLRRYVESIKS